jgi:hypothetical protein
MLTHLKVAAIVVAAAFFLFAPAPASAQTQFEDNFNDGMIDPVWFVNRAGWMSVVEQDGVLLMSGTATQQYWSMGATATLPIVTAPLTIESRFALDASGTGAAAAIIMSEPWSGDSVLLGMNTDPYLEGGGLWLRTTIDDVITDYHLGPIDTNYHTYRITHDGGSLTAYVDDVLEEAIAMPLQGAAVALHANARAIDDVVSARFDYFSLEPAPPAFTPTFSYTFDEVAPSDPDILPADDDCPVGAPCKFLWWVDIPDGQPTLGGISGAFLPPSIVAFADPAVIPDGAITAKHFLTQREGPVGRCATEGTIINAETTWLEATTDPTTTTGSPDDLCSFSRWPTQLNGARDAFLGANVGSTLWSRSVTQMAACVPGDALNILEFAQSDGSTFYLVVFGDPTAPPSPPTVDVCGPQTVKYVGLGVTGDNPDTPENEGGIPLRTCVATGTHTITASLDRNDTPPGDPVVLEDTAICSPNTPTGSGVSVPLNGGTGVLGGIDLTFSNVTGGGSTTVVTTTTGPPPPTGFKIVGLAEIPLYFDINTDASYSGDLTVCMRYDESQVAGPEANLKLMQRVGEGFQNITTSVDTANDVICGATTHLSIFVVAEPLEAALPVGGIAELPAVAGGPAGEAGMSAGGSGWSAGAYAALASAGAAAGVALVLGGWYARRRWLR